MKRRKGRQAEVLRGKEGGAVVRTWEDSDGTWLLTIVGGSGDRRM